MLPEHEVELLGIAGSLLEIGEIPIASMILMNGEVVARTNSSRRRSSRIDHAEMGAMIGLGFAGDAGELVMISSVEPCLMCFGAATALSVTRIEFWLKAAGDGVSAVARDLAPESPLMSRAMPVPPAQVKLLRDYDLQRDRRSDYAGRLLIANGLV